jgi:flagellar hook-associated protein 1 FlgK
MISSTSIFGSLATAWTALASQQTAVTVAGNNVANAATPGYSRQRAELVPIGAQGGVDVKTIQRVRDRFLDFSLLTEQQTLGKNQAQEDVLQRLQAVFNDPPGQGLSAVMDDLFQGFQQLSANPTDQAARFGVKDAGDRLAQTFGIMRGRVDQLKTDVTTEIRQRAGDANSLITQIADLNRQIVSAQPSSPPNDLLDRRDQLVTQLTSIVGVTASDRADGTVQLAMAGTGVLLVDGTSASTLTATVNTATDSVDLTAGANSTVVTPKSGALGALVDARNSTTGAIKQAASDLDTLASTIALQVNRLHASGTGLTEFTTLTSTNAVSSAAAPLTAAGLPFTPVTGSFNVIVHDATGAVVSNVAVPVTAGTTTLTDLQTAINAIPGVSASISGGKLTITAAAGNTFTFAGDTSDALPALGLNTFFTGSTATSLAVNSVVANDVTKVAAATADGAGLVHPGDGSNALALANLSGKLTMTAGTQTFTDFYGSTVARVGSLTQDATEGVTRQQAAVRVVQGLQQQVSGVSTDEEMINLSQSQAVYAAAAHYASTVNDMLQTLLNMLAQATAV